MLTPVLRFNNLVLTITFGRTPHRGEPLGGGGVPPKGGVGENSFPPSERLLRKVKSKLKAEKRKTLWKTKNQKQPFLFRCFRFLLRRNF